jgi:hypothetical protein
MAFAKEILEDKSEEADSIISADNKYYNNDIKEINRAYVYSSKNFGSSVSKGLQSKNLIFTISKFYIKINNIHFFFIFS